MSTVTTQRSWAAAAAAAPTAAPPAAVAPAVPAPTAPAAAASVVHSTPAAPAAPAPAPAVSEAAKAGPIVTPTSTGADGELVRHKTLVLDTNVFIKGVRVERLADELFTVPRVLDEVRDKQSRATLAFLEPLVTVRDPMAASLKHVADFAKKTGDYQSMSLVDLKVVALAYELYQQRVHSSVAKPAQADTAEKSEQQAPASATDTAEAAEEDSEPDSPMGDEAKTAERHEEEVAVAAEPEASKDESKKEEEKDAAAPVQPTPEDFGATGGVDDGEGAWITPENVQSVAQRLRGRLSATKEAVEVGCITTDFACQNVLMQLGVPVIAIDGMHIRKARQWMLKCFSCFHTTRDSRKMFCPSCGNDTLRRVALEMSESGKLTEVTGNGPVRNVRASGSLPLPRGGRHNVDPILSEDVLEARLKRMRKPKGEDGEDFGILAPRELLARNRIQVGHSGKNLKHASGRRKK